MEQARLMHRAVLKNVQRLHLAERAERTEGIASMKWNDVQVGPQNNLSLPKILSLPDNDP